ncbi:hypothetical protein NDU88_005947 [Pleurodeles waltl]|uniref:Uncharacterized protein n=1 Tax=Pleurodeles waltl TaxID=8319 RepID=A0AAV7VMT6_PLEWA|nr:hypothetical protein NDU88_005947 [Pleurodeles waltl]
MPETEKVGKKRVTDTTAFFYTGPATSEMRQQGEDGAREITEAGTQNTPIQPGTNLQAIGEDEVRMVGNIWKDQTSNSKQEVTVVIQWELSMTDATTGNTLEPWQAGVLSPLERETRVHEVYGVFDPEAQPGASFTMFVMEYKSSGRGDIVNRGNILQLLTTMGRLADLKSCDLEAIEFKEDKQLLVNEVTTATWALPGIEKRVLDEQAQLKV